MIRDSKIMAFVATKDAATANNFYQDILGLSLVSDDSFASVFDANGTMLRVQRVQELNPAAHTALGWEVADIVSEVNDLVERGVVFNRYDWLSQDDRAIWPAPAGARIAWFSDPDGNTLSLTQFQETASEPTPLASAG
jgi:catechol 2,3-dioxygenase-like lactoylglutathione lyase family enzyme